MKGSTGIGLALCGAGFALSLVADAYWTTVLAYVAIFAIAALGLTLLTGVAGMISFGQAAFVGIAAYTTGVMTTAVGLSPWLGLVAAVAATATVALAIGAITLRMGGHYLALSTLAWGICTFYTLATLEPLGGFNGLGGIPAPSIGPWSLRSPAAMTALTWTVLALSLLAVDNLLGSRTGRALRSLKQGRAVIAETFGGDVFRLRMLAFVASAVLAALAGWLYAHHQRFLNPTPFAVHAGIELLFMSVLGGASALWGAIAGAAAVTLLKQVLSDVVPRLFGETGTYESVVFGVLMIVVLHRASDGLAPAIDRFARGLRLSLAPRGPDEVRREPSAAQVLARTASVARLPVTPPPVGDAAPPATLRLDDVSKRFGGLTAVDGVSFEATTSAITALIGPNGAGKSTMFNLITGLLAPTGGQVSWDGRTLTGVPVREIVRLGVARTFQHVKLVPGMTVLDAVAMGAYCRYRGGALRSSLRLDRHEEDGIRRDAMDALGRVGLAHAARLPADTLSLGEQRIVEVARALASKPRMLMLDEPAAGLRYHEKRALGDLLIALRAEGLGILLVEHDMDFVMRLSDHIVVMNFGRRISEGAPDEVRRDPAVVEAYLGVAA